MKLREKGWKVGAKSKRKMAEIDAGRRVENWVIFDMIHFLQNMNQTQPVHRLQWTYKKRFMHELRTGSPDEKIIITV